MKFLHEIVKYPNAELPYDNGYWLIVRGEPVVGNTIRVENYNGGFHDHVVTENDVIVEMKVKHALCGIDCECRMKDPAD